MTDEKIRNLHINKKEKIIIIHESNLSFTNCIYHIFSGIDNLNMHQNNQTFIYKKYTSSV